MMKFGIINIYLALIALAYSSWFYFEAFKNKKEINNSSLDYYIKHARFGFYAMTAFITSASIYLWYLIFTHQFQVDYIYRYTSSDLGIGYLVSAFWAGQEGSFLFWALMVAVMGTLFLSSAKKLESSAMLVVNIIQAAFIILLIKASPFELSGSLPIEGAGLNPLLQNPWMVIHPPILFLGYAATTIPCAIAIAAMVNREYSQWVKLAIPWTLFASITMGAGIIIGGYWAYKVLGWGGYWGWDPVENSSLVAWIVVLALFHGLLITRFKGSFSKTNLALSICSFVFVLYATFLTRSGVLADFSVHSFQDLGINGYLIFYLVTSFFGGFLLLYLRKNEIPFVKISADSLSKETILVLSVVVLSASAFFILIGTSSPIITNFLGNPAQVDVSFYNKVNLPIGILMALFLGIAPVLSWTNMETRVVVSKLTASLAIASITAVVAILIGMEKVINIVFLVSVMFALTSNVISLIDKAKGGWQLVVAPIAHIGVALMFIGIIVSGVFDETQRIVLKKESAQKTLGYDLTYKGKFINPDGKNGVLIEVSDGNSKYIANPRLYSNDYNKSEMREPYVEEQFLSDLYISPLQIVDGKGEKQSNSITMVKGEKKQIGGYEVQFDKYDITNHEQEIQNIRVAAILQLSKGESSFEIKPALLLKGNEMISEPAFLTADGFTNNQLQVDLKKINPDKKNIQLQFDGIPAGESVGETSEQIVVEISRKPLMSVLWIGTIILTLGTIMAMKRRSLELQISSES